MEDKPLLHSCKFDDLVLEYLFGDGHRESFPKRNPHMNKLTHMMIRVRNSTIAQPFQAGYLCMKVVDFISQVLNFVGCLIADDPQTVAFVGVAQEVNNVVH
jgi:hypothetical protein